MPKIQVIQSEADLSFGAWYKIVRRGDDWFNYGIWKFDGWDSVHLSFIDQNETQLILPRISQSELVTKWVITPSEKL